MPGFWILFFGFFGSILDPARIRHSGSNAESGQDIAIQYNPSNNNSNKDPKAFHRYASQYAILLF
jgi:hypothetical protein